MRQYALNASGLTVETESEYIGLDFEALKVIRNSLFAFYRYTLFSWRRETLC